MSNLDEILRRPIIDITEPVEISSQDAVNVIANAHIILGKCQYCIRQALAVPMEVLLFLIAQAALFEPDHFCQAVLEVAGEDNCVDLLAAVVRQLLSRECASLRLQLNIEILFQVVQVLCNHPRLKSMLVEKMGMTFLDFMLDTSQHADDYRVHRSCASAIITLLRGSAANKRRLSTECGKVVACLEHSFDFFFQMQCTEIIFRLFIYDASVLTQTPMNDYLHRISSLPNDATLLLSIQNFLDGYNAEFNASNILPFTIVRIEAGGNTICGHTTIYFSRFLVVVMLPGGTGDSFSIPFEHIRSVKLSKDHKLCLRLNTIPRRLSNSMNLAEGQDILHVFLTQSTLVRLRSCNVHEWISIRKYNAPRRQTILDEIHAESAKSIPTETLSDAVVRVQGHRPSKELPKAPSSMSERLPNNINMPERIPTKPSQPPIQGNDQLGVIENAAAIKTMRYREQKFQHLRLASDRLQEHIENLQQLNGQDRNNFESTFRENITIIREAETSLKQSAAECVKSLNRELEDLQALGTALKGEVDKLRERLANSVGKSEGVEESCLGRIKELVDSRIRMIETQMSSLWAELTPLSRVMSSLRQHI